MNVCNGGIYVDLTSEKHLIRLFNDVVDACPHAVSFPVNRIVEHIHIRNDASKRILNFC